MAPIEPRADTWARVLATVEPSTRFAGFVERLTVFFDLDPEPVRTLLRTVDVCPSHPWEASVSPGMQLLHLDGGPRVASAD